MLGYGGTRAGEKKREDNDIADARKGNQHPWITKVGIILAQRLVPVADVQTDMC